MPEEINKTEAPASVADAAAAAAGTGEGGAKQPTVEELQAEIKAKDAAIAERDSKLAGYVDKEFNFKKLREMTDAEKNALSAKEKEILQRQELLETETKSFKEGQIKTHQDDALAVLAGDDEEMRKKILHHYGRIQGEAVTRDQIQSKMREAALLAGAGSAQTIDPFQRATGHMTGAAPQINNKKELTPEQQALAAKFGITNADLEKHKK